MKLEKNSSFWILLIVSFLFFLFRWPSLFEPYWYGDEGVYQAVGMLINNGASLYSGAWENKPPLLLLIYAFFNSDQFLIKTASLISGLISVWFFYFIAKKLFPKSQKGVILSTFIFTFLFGTNILEGNIANAENFMLLPIMITAYLIVSSEFTKKLWAFRIYLFAGLLLSVAFLTKVVAIFDFLAFGLFIFINADENLKDKFHKKITPFILGFIILPVLTAGYFLATNNFMDFMNAFILRNIGYVGAENELLIPQGLLILKFFILLVFLFFLYYKRKKISKSVLFVFIWFSFSIFNAYFSQRPYTHYLLVLLPSFSLMIGAVSEKKERFLTLLILLFTIIFISKTFIIKTKKIIPYYLNLISFCMDKKSVDDYRAFFDKRTTKDYLLANYIKSTTDKNDKVFIWGNNAQVYKLTDKTPIFRYTVAYHAINFPNGILEMKNAIDNIKPKYIVIMPDVPAFPLALSDYEERGNIENIIIYEKTL